jgi:hypothetical protein
MGETIMQPTGNITSGSRLLCKDDVPLSAGEVREAVVEAVNVSNLVLDVMASHSCTLQVIRMPDGVSTGEASSIGYVSAETPVSFAYSQCWCHSMKIVITNTSGSNMSSFRLHARGAN